MKTGRDKLGYNKWILAVDLIVFSLVSWFISAEFYRVNFENYILQLGPAVLVVGVSLYLVSAFEISLNVSLSSLISRNIISIAIALSILLVIIYFLGPGSGRNVYGRGVLLSTMIAFGVYLIVTRYLLFKYLRNIKPFHQWVFIGDENHFLEVKDQAEALNRHLVDKQPVDWLKDNLGRDPNLGVILEEGIYANGQLAQQLINAKFNGIKIYSVNQFCESYLEKIPLFSVKENWFLSSAGFGYINDSIRQRVKRTIELSLVTITLPLTTLLVGISMFLILILDKQSPIFSQKRIGQHGRVFRIYKLKTMVNGHKLSEGEWTEHNDQRITTLGKILRRYRLDEIPQLFNVIRGEMNIIGPRPEQPSYTVLLEKQIPYYDVRHSVKPGITGWAQVKFPYGASVDDARSKLEYDIYYIKNYSLSLDISIFLKTVYTITSGSGR